MPLRVAVLALCAWGENLACGVAWQSLVSLVKQTRLHGKFGLANVVKMVLVGKTMCGNTANSARKK